MPNPYNLILGLAFSTIGGIGIIHAWKNAAMKALTLSIALTVIPFILTNPWIHLIAGTTLTIFLWKNRED